MRDKDPVKREQAQKAKQLVIDTLFGKTLKITTYKPDKYGRYLAEFFIDGNFTTMGNKLIAEGLAVSYFGGTKVAIRTSLEKYHNAEEHDGMSLGAMQNRAEGGDHYVNQEHRVLSEDRDKPGHFHTNHNGIFPPLLSHDNNHHEWSHVGHVKDMKKSDFRNLTKTDSHPNGISHEEFVDALARDHDRNHGKYWELGAATERRLDHVGEHPLVQNFLAHQWDTGASPNDYRQLKNMGVWEHPHTGEKHIVARDHGVDHDVAGAYKSAFKRRREANQEKYQRGY